jgi:crotonobetaine/carnitine-CoA ligase
VSIAGDPPHVWCYGQLLSYRAESHSEKIFARFPADVVTYGELERRANSLGNALLGLGFRKGERIAVMAANSPQFLMAWFGLEKAGLVLVPVNTALKGKALVYLLSQSGARGLLLDEEFLGICEPALREVTAIETVIVNGKGSNGEIPLRDLTCGDSEPPNSGLAEGDMTAIMYTSGTTGPPKGVVHRDRLTFARVLLERLPYRSSDILYTFLPLFHGSAQNLTVGIAMLAGAECAIDPRFTASRFWERVGYYNATVFNYLGGVLPILYSQPPRPNDANNTIRFAVGSGVPADLVDSFEERFGLVLVDLWSSTEGGLTLNAPERRHGSVGKPVLKYSEVRVADEEGSDVPFGAVGEIIWRFTQEGRQVEYYGMPEATAERIIGDGWFRSGDLGSCDPDGFVYFHGRLKDCIRRRGENISAWELETLILDHPDVIEVAAFGVPSDVGEDDVKVCLVLRNGAAFVPAQFIRWCEDRMAYFMVPRYVEVVEKLEKTETEKVQKEALKEAWENDQTWDRERTGIKLRR